MKKGIYTKLALSGIKNNKQLYIPFILSGILMAAVSYILMFLKSSPAVIDSIGKDMLVPILNLGSFIIVIFSLIFLFYTNSFLMGRRKKEFGLYNILGLNKRNISFVLLIQMLFMALLVIGGGLLFGIALSKLAELVLVNILKFPVNYSFSVSIEAISWVITAFGIIFFLLFIYSFLSFNIKDPIETIKSENTGEKPPKGNFLLGSLGLILIVVAYYLAATIKDPEDSITVFFIAVTLVIIGTFLLLISGSVWLINLLKKNKSYYYNKNHFISVSSMAFRMKRNGAGLASICILSTMVLVTVSMTACLYMGIRNSIDLRYPKDFNTSVSFESTDMIFTDKTEEVVSYINNSVSNYGADIFDINSLKLASSGAFLDGEKLFLSSELEGAEAQYNLLNLIDLSEYNRAFKVQETLAPDEVLLYSTDQEFHPEEITFKDRTFKVKTVLPEFINTGSSMYIYPSLFIVFNDLEEFLAETDSTEMFSGQFIYDFNTDMSEENQEKFVSDFSFPRGSGIQSYRIEAKGLEEEFFYIIYGGIFFIGILLSSIFLITTVLIIYYKQITEGFEDRKRIKIMENIGLTKDNIKKNINSQLLIIFFIPLILAGIHLIFAYPLMNKLLILMSFDNPSLFILTTMISALVFALFYMVIYKLTSNTYFKIVS